MENLAAVLNDRRVQRAMDSPLVRTSAALGALLVVLRGDPPSLPTTPY